MKLRENSTVYARIFQDVTRILLEKTLDQARRTSWMISFSLPGNSPCLNLWSEIQGWLEKLYVVKIVASFLRRMLLCVNGRLNGPVVSQLPRASQVESVRLPIKEVFLDDLIVLAIWQRVKVSILEVPCCLHK